MCVCPQASSESVNSIRLNYNYRFSLAFILLRLRIFKPCGFLSWPALLEIEREREWESLNLNHSLLQLSDLTLLSWSFWESSLFLSLTLFTASDHHYHLFFARFKMPIFRCFPFGTMEVNKSCCEFNAVYNERICAQKAHFNKEGNVSVRESEREETIPVLPEC